MNTDDGSSNDRMREIPDETEQNRLISKMWNHRRVAPGAKCEKCGKPNVYPMPTVSIGSGGGYKAVADDVYCGYCGAIAPARW